jgi:hypothetical protein
MFFFKDYFESCLIPNSSFSWTSISLENFVSYKCNLGFNRQTRMLAQYDSKFSVCDYLNNKDSKKFDREIFDRAIQGLHSLSFFGLVEYQQESRQLFEKTFNNDFKFKNGVNQLVLKKVNKKKVVIKKKIDDLNQSMKQKVDEVNRLDIKLYQYARRLFFERLTFYGI